MIVGLVLLMTLAMHSAEVGCEPGVHRTHDGEPVALFVSPSEKLRYTYFDGRRGALDAADAEIHCTEERLLVEVESQQPLEPIPVRVVRTHFWSQGVRLAGELIEARDAGPETPLVVMAHGSESFGWIGGRNPMPYLLAARGVSTFIFDKRGTGQSDGEFHMNFPRLARDVAAATDEARRLAEGRHGPIGIHGFSQGGWVAPLAALDARADFVVVNYGLVLSPLEEDAEEVQAELREHGYAPEVLARAREVTDATATLVLSKFQQGYERLAQVKALYGEEPWFELMQGEYTGRLLAEDEQRLRSEGQALFDRFDLVWDYDSIPPIAALDVPLLWIAAGSDRAAPPQLTLDRLTRLQEAGNDVQIATFPDTDHGIVEFVEKEDGSRMSTRHADGYFGLLVDWSKGCLDPPYGTAVLSEVRGRDSNCPQPAD